MTLPELRRMREGILSLLPLLIYVYAGSWLGMFWQAPLSLAHKLPLAHENQSNLRASLALQLCITAGRTQRTPDLIFSLPFSTYQKRMCVKDCIHEIQFKCTRSLPRHNELSRHSVGNVKRSLFELFLVIFRVKMAFCSISNFHP